MDHYTAGIKKIVLHNVSIDKMKSTEVQTSPMLASHAQLLPCGMYIHMLVALNATKYVIMTDVTTRLNLEESHQYSSRSISAGDAIMT